MILELFPALLDIMPLPMRAAVAPDTNILQPEVNPVSSESEEQ